MVVNDGDVLRPGVRPPEDKTPLVVDANGVETRQIAAQSFEMVAGVGGEVAEESGLVQLDQFP